MRVWAYCAAGYAESVRRAAGVEPVVCPPTTAETLDLRVLENRDLIFLKLHSLPDAHALLGSPQGPPVALRSEQLRAWGVDLGGAVVFAAVCYMGDASHPMRQAFLEAGASAVIAGPGQNYGSVTGELKGVDLLGVWVRRWLRVGFGVSAAIGLARQRVRLAARRSEAARDALEFDVFV